MSTRMLEGSKVLSNRRVGCKEVAKLQSYRYKQELRSNRLINRGKVRLPANGPRVCIRNTLAANSCSLSAFSAHKQAHKEDAVILERQLSSSLLIRLGPCHAVLSNKALPCMDTVKHNTCGLPIIYRI